MLIDCIEFSKYAQHMFCIRVSQSTHMMRMNRNYSKSRYQKDERDSKGTKNKTKRTRSGVVRNEKRYNAKMRHEMSNTYMKQEKKSKKEMCETWDTSMRSGETDWDNISTYGTTFTFTNKETFSSNKDILYWRCSVEWLKNFLPQPSFSYR